MDDKYKGFDNSVKSFKGFLYKFENKLFKIAL